MQFYLTLASGEVVAPQLDADSVGVDKEQLRTADHGTCTTHVAHLRLQGGDVALGVGETLHMGGGHRARLLGGGTIDSATSPKHEVLAGAHVVLGDGEVDFAAVSVALADAGHDIACRLDDEQLL